MWKHGKESDDTQQIIEIPVSSIRPGRFQPRFAIKDEDLDELVASIQQVGLLQPVLVRPQGLIYELIAGERRLRACARAGIEQIPAVVRKLSDAEAAEAALIENLQRRSLHFFEEAEAYAKLIRDYDLTQNQVAQRVGLGQSTIANKLRLLGLEEDVRKRIYENGMTERHARALLDVKEHQLRLEALDEASGQEMSVKEWERFLRREKARIISREINMSRKRMKPLIKDLRLFLNSLERGVETLRAAGMEVQFQQQRDGNRLRVEIEVDANAVNK